MVVPYRLGLPFRKKCVFPTVLTRGEQMTFEDIYFRRFFLSFSVAFLMLGSLKGLSLAEECSQVQVLKTCHCEALVMSMVKLWNMTLSFVRLRCAIHRSSFVVPFGLAKQEDKVTHQATRSLGVLICSTANCFGSFGKNCRASTINVVNGSQENRARAKRTDTLESWRRVVLTIYTNAYLLGRIFLARPKIFWNHAIQQTKFLESSHFPFRWPNPWTQQVSTGSFIYNSCSCR